MAARWDKLYIKRYTRKSDYTLTWVYGESWRSSVRLQKNAFNILLKSKQKIAEQFGESEYWFPSPSKHHKGEHIKSVILLWERCLEELGINYVSPKALRKEYYSNRYYGLDDAMGIIDERLEMSAENVAKLSI